MKSASNTVPFHGDPIAILERVIAEVQHAAVAATAGDNTLVAAVSGQQIVVLQCNLIASADATVRFESGAGGTALSGIMQLRANDEDATANSSFAAANGQILLPYSPAGWMKTAAAALLNLEVVGGAVNGHLSYVTV